MLGGAGSDITSLRGVSSGGARAGLLLLRPFSRAETGRRSAEVHTKKIGCHECVAIRPATASSSSTWIFSLGPLRFCVRPRGSYDPRVRAGLISCDQQVFELSAANTGLGVLGVYVFVCFSTEA